MARKPAPGTPLDPSHPLSRNCFGAFLLGEGGSGVGIAKNSAPSTFHGRLTNFATSGIWAPGPHGGLALTFDNTNDYVDCGTVRVGGAGTSVGLSFWARIYRNAAQESGIFAERNVSTGWVFAVRATNTLAWWDGSAYRAGTVGVVPTGEWCDVGVSNTEAGVLSFYVNGVLAGTNTNGLTGVTANLTIGAWDAGATGRVNGRFDEARYWVRRVLTAGDFALLHKDPYAGYLLPRVDVGVPSAAMGLASETDSALGVGQSMVLGLASETDSVLSLLQSRIEIASETDSALSVRPNRTYALGLATETDSALSVTMLTGVAVPLGLASETDSALSLNYHPLGIASETDTAFPILPVQTGRWPYDDLKPRHIGIYPCASPIGGGVALTGKEPVIDSGAGYWRIVYGGVYVKNRAQVHKYRQYEGLFEGRGRSLLIYLFDGKRAPWPNGVVGDPITVTANAAVTAEATSIALNATSAGELKVGQHFSVGHYLYRITAISAPVGSVYSATIWPPTREAIASGASLEFRRPVLRVRLANDGDMSLLLNHLRFGDGNIEFVEDVP